jgi:hypothetical protein
MTVDPLMMMMVFFDGFSRMDFSIDEIVKGYKLGTITLQTEQVFPLPVPLAKSQMPAILFLLHVT